ncbi:MAG: LicD family protein [Gammaproteobacteria bacterium]|nr:LicD family protein [Gammaproteobacteria bacterium]MBT8444101.1 LicD family protein [Gammaproteobacteria bacterium]NND37931.1 hypothetical protein [Gammaproteobacteria bacterium]
MAGGSSGTLGVKISQHARLNALSTTHRSVLNDSKARRALHDINTIFDRHDVMVWLDCGTLLGAVREKDFIAWDNDIDLAIWSEDLIERDMEKVWRDLHRHRFNVYLLQDKLILERDNIPVNASIYYRDGDDARRAVYPLHEKFLSKAVRALWWVAAAENQASSVRPAWPLHPVSLSKRLLVGLMGAVPNRVRQKIQGLAYRACLAAGCSRVDWRVPARFFDDFRLVHFSGDDWSIPEQSVDYLRFRYGDDWDTPKQNFSSIRDDGAIRR